MTSGEECTLRGHTRGHVRTQLRSAPLSCVLMRVPGLRGRSRNPLAPLRLGRLLANPLSALGPRLGLGGPPFDLRIYSPETRRFIRRSIRGPGSLPARACDAIGSCGKTDPRWWNHPRSGFRGVPRGRASTAPMTAGAAHRVSGSPTSLTWFGSVAAPIKPSKNWPSCFDRPNAAFAARCAASGVGTLRQEDHTHLLALLFANSRTPAVLESPRPRCPSGRSASPPFSALARRLGLGATPLHPSDGRPRDRRLLPPLLPLSGSLPARADGASDPCGKVGPR